MKQEKKTIILLVLEKNTVFSNRQISKLGQFIKEHLLEVELAFTIILKNKHFLKKDFEAINEILKNKKEIDTIIFIHNKKILKYLSGTIQKFKQEGLNTILFS